MRFKSQSQRSELPEVNLVPMMDVLMTILTFFIIIAMTMSNVRSLDLQLPSSKAGSVQSQTPVALRVELTAQGQFRVNHQSVNEDELKQNIRTYLAQNPQGVVLLSADRTLPYERVMTVLSEMEALGGDRISLALEP